MHLCLNVDEILRLIARELVASRGKGPPLAWRAVVKVLKTRCWTGCRRHRMNYSRYSNLFREMFGAMVDGLRVRQRSLVSPFLTIRFE